MTVKAYGAYAGDQSLESGRSRSTPPKNACDVKYRFVIDNPSLAV